MISIAILTVHINKYYILISIKLVADRIYNATGLAELQQNAFNIS